MSEPNYRFHPTSAPPLRSSVAAAEPGTLDGFVNIICSYWS